MCVIHVGVFSKINRLNEYCKFGTILMLRTTLSLTILFYKIVPGKSCFSHSDLSTDFGQGSWTVAEILLVPHYLSANKKNVTLKWCSLPFYPWSPPTFCPQQSLFPTLQMYNKMISLFLFLYIRKMFNCTICSIIHIHIYYITHTYM